MPVISDAASVVKSRFGFHNPSGETLPLRSPADVPKSASKDNFRDPPLIQYPHSIEVPVETSSQSFKLCDDPSFWEDHNVQVIIRIRPLSSSEVSVQGYRKCIRQDSCQTITWTGHPESRFTFDVVADENVSQEKLFMISGIPMVDNCMSGYNSCMFAYGQTGSGKTHTMLGDIEGGTRRHNVNCGMTPRVFDHLFTQIQKEKEARRDEKLKYTCKCSFLEIYNEQILDLLDPSSTNLQIREDTRKGVYVENLKVIEVTSARDVMQQLLQGAANRKVAATNMNRASSRSHSVFTCTIESSWEAQGVSHHRFARLNLVDLAGSERQKSTGAEGERLKEATNINKSLSTLGLVIMNLVNVSNGKSLHVPYRDSKLTFLLQDSLGGNSKTIMIANISPSICCSLETLSTLKFAQRAKFIKNDAIVNEDASGDVAMRVQIQQLKKEIAYLRSSVNGKTEYQESELSTMSIPGSPSGSKCEGLHESFSPFLLEKSASHKEDFEVALVGAFKREKEKDIELETLTAENQAAMKLLKEREVEIQGLKMRLRFREDAKKRLEAVQSRELSVESHMLKEKEELLKEMEILRVQADRNQEVTRFAMENLRLKEEIRRLKSFCEEEEREMLNQQITVLENKLLDALDWKLMHEADIGPSSKKNADNFGEGSEDANLQISSQPALQQVSPWHAAAHEENEFLRLQAIQNQSEIDSLRQKLILRSQEKEKLEMSVNELSAKLEQERTSRQEPSVTAIALDRQKELNTMVEAIAAASLREAEAHEAAIALSKENDELRKKLGVLIDDNNKLIDLYDETRNSSIAEADVREVNEIKNEATEMRNVVKNLEHQLTEMHEENEKLMGLYEKAMRERDEFKRMFTSAVEESDFQKVDIIKFTGDTALARQKLHIIEDGISTTAARVLRHALSTLSSTIIHFEEREAQAKARAHTAFSYVDHKKEELRKLQSRKNEIEKSIVMIRQSDVEVRTHLGSLKTKFKETNKRHENRKVLFAIDNVENGTARNWQLDVTATELLMVEEENTKLQNEMNKCREKMIMLKKELENANKKYQHVVSMIDVAEKELQTGSKSSVEAELALEGVVTEKKMLLEFQENGEPKLDSLVFEYIEYILQADLRSAELKIVEEEHAIEPKKIEAYGSRRYAEMPESRDSSEISRIIEELENTMNCVDEVKYLLEN